MTQQTSKIIVIRGKTSYAKIFGTPPLNYAKDGREWTFDLEISPATVKELKAEGIGDRVKTKDKYLDGKPFLTFKQRELKKDGSPNDPIKVVEADGITAWNTEKLLGNGTVVDAKFAIRDYGPGKKKGVYIRSIRVLDLVPYQQQEFAPLTEDDEFYNMETNDLEQIIEDAKKASIADDLDDEIPIE